MNTEKYETEENMRLLLSVLDSLDLMYERLNRLNNVIQRKNIEQILCQKEDNRNEN